MWTVTTLRRCVRRWPRHAPAHHVSSSRTPTYWVACTRSRARQTVISSSSIMRCSRRSRQSWTRRLREPPYKTVLKPYGQALLALARRRRDIVCLGADLTRQTETDLFRDELGKRFINAGMAEANMIGVAGGLARAGHIVFVNTFGVFCTRRCYDQIAMAVAYPNLNVKIVGFMPGVSSPGGPSH